MLEDLNAAEAELTAILADLQAIVAIGGAADWLGDDRRRDIQARIVEAQTRIADRVFRVAVLGTVKQGKTTLINALIGGTVAPPQAIPASSVLIRIRHGAEKTACVHFLGSDAHRPAVPISPDAIGIWATQAGQESHVFLPGRGAIPATPTPTPTGNAATGGGASVPNEAEAPGEAVPLARLNYEIVVTWPAAWLGEGVELIDTPGPGSTHGHHDVITAGVLPSCHAAVLLVSGNDKPVGEIERTMLLGPTDAEAASQSTALPEAERARLQMKIDERVGQLFVLQNVRHSFDETTHEPAWDTPPPHERDERERFNREKLRDLLGRDVDHYEQISALMAHAARAAGDEKLWRRSGLDDFLRELETFLVRGRTPTVLAVAHKAILAPLATLKRQIAVQKHALENQLDDLKRQRDELQPHLDALREQRDAVVARIATGFEAIARTELDGEALAAAAEEALHRHLQSEIERFLRDLPETYFFDTLDLSGAAKAHYETRVKHMFDSLGILVGSELRSRGGDIRGRISDQIWQLVDSVDADLIAAQAAYHRAVEEIWRITLPETLVHLDAALRHSSLDIPEPATGPMDWLARVIENFRAIWQGRITTRAVYEHQFREQAKRLEASGAAEVRNLGRGVATNFSRQLETLASEICGDANGICESVIGDTTGRLDATVRAMEQAKIERRERTEQLEALSQTVQQLERRVDALKAQVGGRA